MAMDPASKQASGRGGKLPHYLLLMAKSKESAGLLLYRRRDARIEILLAHPGGPLWKKKDAGAWTLPKGELKGGEDALGCARREFEEETGFSSQGPFLPLGSIRQRSGKLVHAWAFEGDCDTKALRSNSFEMEWPPRSGKMQSFPEVDRAEFFDIESAREKLNPAQGEFLDRLLEAIGGEEAEGS